MNSNLLREVLKMMNGKISGNFSKEEEKNKVITEKLPPPPSE